MSSVLVILVIRVRRSSSTSVVVMSVVVTVLLWLLRVCNLSGYYWLRCYSSGAALCLDGTADRPRVHEEGKVPCLGYVRSKLTRIKALI